MFWKSIYRITGLCAVASMMSVSAAAQRADAALWTPIGGNACKVTYHGKDINAKKAVEILTGAKPDEYFDYYVLAMKKMKGCSQESYKIETDSARKTVTVIAPSGKGLLYGALSLYRPSSCSDRVDFPKNDIRVLNHWDNLNGTVERGYAGKSIWNWDEPISPEKKALYEKYALANAMAGINGTVINNVNASPSMLKDNILQRVAEIADILRPYGIKVYISVNFASPSALGGLPTADPLDKDVIQWWKNKTKQICSIIPDFGGFLVKANSEGEPGPCDYGRSHADGANMLAKALKPYGGIVMWRAFVYSASDADRAKQAYNEFMPLDGKFDSNVLIQVKNGPVDFQPREPYSPLFAGMKKTPLIAELQITQEYLGHANHLAYLAPLWTEFFEEAPTDHMKGVAGVANIGDAENFTGNPLAQANWYAFGRLAWDPVLKSADIVKEWVGLTPWFNAEGDNLLQFIGMMESSREYVVDYMMPMGLHHLFAFGHHYGPEPWCEVPGARPDWLPKYYHKADSKGIGFDRTSASGSGATMQYPLQYAAILEDADSCPEKYILWFHHLDWNHKLPSGESLWDALNRHYDNGVAGVDEMRNVWKSLKLSVDEDVYEDIATRLLIQHKDAIWWRDGCLEYFGMLAGKSPAKNSMHRLSDMQGVTLGIDNYTNPSKELLDSKR